MPPGPPGIFVWFLQLPGGHSQPLQTGEDAGLCTHLGLHEVLHPVAPWIQDIIKETLSVINKEAGEFPLYF